MYDNSHGIYLYVMNEGNWAVGYKIGNYSFKSRWAPLRPTEEEYWVYWNGSEDIPADIEVSYFA